ncbi:MAG: hypothetical protein ACRC10_06865 [Thermoguttaceae bacterium]
MLLFLFVGMSAMTFADEIRVAPNLLGDRSLERTGFQEASAYHEDFDLQTDFVMPYGISEQAINQLQPWKDAQYVLELMTGVSWGGYEDFLDGKFDGIDHWDDAQCDPEFKQILHGPRVPYMVPSIAFSRYLEEGLKKVVDSGVVAVHLEEPEFWARAGFSDSFKREWLIYYNEPWIRPDSSCDAQFRASKLKYYLYRRMLDRLCSSLKEYSLVQHKRPVRFFVPTHSLVNYAQWAIVSPESSLLDLPGIDGLIAQVWTGTARTPNIYQGEVAERTFETAYLEYCNMQEMTRGTGKRMYFLHDPIEDNPKYDWNDYRKNYICTLVASLLQPDVWYYEVCPWPSRVFRGKYPVGDPNAEPIPGDYATLLNILFGQLRDMEQPDVSWEQGTEGIGVFLGDSAMFQRAEPAFREGTVRGTNDVTRANREEVSRFAGYYGLTLPFVKHGVPIRSVQLDNILRAPGYLDRFKVLILSYEFQKPLHPGINAGLADWVSRGGILVYVGADTDPFHHAKEWWNQGVQPFRTPTEHLLQLLGQDKNAENGSYDCGKGQVVVVRKHPAYFGRSAKSAEELRSIVRDALQKKGESLIERNYFLLRRGPYVIAATMNESISDSPLVLKGRFVNLLDSSLPIVNEIVIEPGSQSWLLDLEKVTAKAPAMLSAAGRLENWVSEPNELRYTILTPNRVETTCRILLPKEPVAITVDGQPVVKTNWDSDSSTLFLQHPGNAKGVPVHIKW